MRGYIPDLQQIEAIRSLPFVRDARVHPPGDVLEIETPQGKNVFRVIVQRTHFDESSADVVIARASNLERTAGLDPAGKVIVFAPYLSRETAKDLVAAGVSFADEAGNIHLALGDDYSWTLIGERRPRVSPEARRVTPAAMQLLFQLASNPESANWNIRDLAAAAGLGKSKVAQLKTQFVHEELIKPGKKGKTFHLPPDRSDELISGYVRTLRPKIFIGRYRHADPSSEGFIAHLHSVASTGKLRYALTGGPAADALLHMYQTPDVPIFIADHDATILRQLRLLPDREGSVTLLHAFAPLVYWREVEGTTVAPPWLIYAELLASRNSRDREVAVELHERLLS